MFFSGPTSFASLLHRPKKNTPLTAYPSPALEGIDSTAGHISGDVLADGPIRASFGTVQTIGSHIRAQLVVPTGLGRHGACLFLGPTTQNGCGFRFGVLLRPPTMGMKKEKTRHPHIGRCMGNSAFQFIVCLF